MENRISGERNDLRKIAVYLLKTRSAATNREIGEAVGGMSGFAVAKTFQRIRTDMSQDKKFGKKVKELEERLSCVKG